MTNFEKLLINNKQTQVSNNLMTLIENGEEVKYYTFKATYKNSDDVKYYYYYFQEGMTWEEYLTSSVYEGPSFIWLTTTSSSSGTTKTIHVYNNDKVLYEVDGNQVLPEDVINSEVEYCVGDPTK